MERFLLYYPPDMEQRKFGDILAFKNSGSAPIAFHARNLEVAEISDELWNSIIGAGKEIQDLRDWEQENNPNVISNSTSRKQSLTINVTQICNLMCTYCAAGGDGTYGQPQTKISVEKTLPQLQFFMKRTPAGGEFRLTFLGGEPLLYPEGIKALAEYVKNECAALGINPSFSIVTNGTLLNEENVQLLNDINCDVAVSIDGPSEYNDHARILKNGEGSTAKVLEGIKYLAANRTGIGRLALYGVFSQNNMHPYAAFKLYEGLQVDCYDFSYDVNTPNEELNREFVKQMNRIADEAYAAGGEAGLRKISFFDSVFSTLDNQTRNENFCRAGKSHFVLDAKNNVFACPWDVGQEDQKVGEGSYLSEKRLAPYEPSLIEKNDCQKCWARFVCGGGCMFIHKQGTGDKVKKDHIFCERTRSLILIAINYYKLTRAVS